MIALVGLIAWIAAGLIMLTLKLFRVKHRLDVEDVAGFAFGFIVGVPVALCMYLGLGLLAYGGLRSFFPSLPAVHRPWWPEQ
jgi:hypothetical protein